MLENFVIATVIAVNMFDHFRFYLIGGKLNDIIFLLLLLLWLLVSYVIHYTYTPEPIRYTRTHICILSFRILFIQWHSVFFVFFIVFFLSFFSLLPYSRSRLQWVVHSSTVSNCLWIACRGQT